MELQTNDNYSEKKKSNLDKFNIYKEKQELKVGTVNQKKDFTIFYQHKIKEMELLVKEKIENLTRLRAERNLLNDKVRMIREELDSLKGNGSHIGTVIKKLDSNKVLVKVHPEGKFVVDIDKNIDVNDIIVNKRVALHHDSYSLYKVLNTSVDPLVTLMMVEKVPDSTYEEVGGLSKQIREIKEVIELPMKHPEVFDILGITQPKGVLLYGPPGTGKTLLARAVAHHTNCTFIRVSGSELVQKFIGEGTRMIKELFIMARERAPSIIFIDEIDSIGTKRSEDAHGDSEVDRTMLELLNQLDGFESSINVKVIMATNRIDILDSALLRPGRIDRKIYFPSPDESARLDILGIHSKKMNLKRGINMHKIAEMIPGANGAELKCLCTEAGMCALRERRTHVTQEDFEMAVSKVSSEQKLRDVSFQQILNMSVPLEDQTIWNDGEDSMGEEVLRMSTDEIISRTRLLDNEIKIMKSEVMRITHELQAQKEKIRENNEKIKVNKTLPYLVSNVIELLDVDPQELAEEDGANVDLDSQRKGKCAVIKTSTRQTYFLPVIGLVDAEKLKPGDLVGVNKDSYLILETLPQEYDSRVKAMEVDERPTEQYSDIGGLDKQIQELIEAVVLPMTHKEKFENLGIQPPKGVLLYGPPGTGKTLMARACAAQTKSTFLKLAGPQLVQMFIGDGAKLVRDAFALAKEKAPAIIFIDELDAIGTKRFDSEKAGDREVQRTMLELLNQLDGFSSQTDIKVIAATNRVDILDPALLRSGRLDRKIEFPHPNEEARARIMQIHSRKMNIDPDVNFEELARCTDDFNGAQCKAVCVEAGMIALRREATVVTHEDFMDAILEVQAKKKANLNYYA
ncbi:uncharacterized protein LOC111618314 [Centruroides sculpturatus]|uniref:uncharacterized protein LOC111618314 n=2 Tax=Centruroides TaxID=6875 RepID=UPI000C6CD46B|nr:uncharacterized protein LOC111618314 [Centruroides sculpturatus]